MGLFLFPYAASAQATYTHLVPIPGMPSNAGVLDYLSGLYNFVVAVVGIVAMGAIVIGGARYLTAAGNPSAVEDAKHTINSAIYGLLLALTSWVIIREINPDILVLKNPAMNWGASGYLGTLKNPLAGCNPGGVGNGTTSPCLCADGASVTFTPSTITGPYVTSTTPNPCQDSVPGTLPYSIIINFNEPMDSTTILTPGSITVTPAIVGTPSMPTSSQVKLDLTQPLSPATEYTVTLVGGGAFNKNIAGVAMQSDYVFYFTTDNNIIGCTPPTVIVQNCVQACSNASTPGLNPPGYHCVKADLRIGTTPNPPSGSKDIEVYVNDKIYFDALSGSIDYAWPNLKTNVSPDNAAYDNGIDAYLIKNSKQQPWNDDPTDPNNVLGVLGTNIIQYDSTSCTFLGGLGSWVGGFLGIKAGKGYFSYGTAGEYQVVLNVRSKNNCGGPAVDIGHVVVKQKP